MNNVQCRCEPRTRTAHHKYAAWAGNLETSGALAWLAAGPQRQSCPAAGWRARRRRATAPEEGGSGPLRKARLGPAWCAAQTSAAVGHCTGAGTLLAKDPHSSGILGNLSYTRC